LAGKVKVNSAPLPYSDITFKLPPSPSLIRELKLRPMLCELGLRTLLSSSVVLKCGLNIFGRSASLIPIPWSITLIETENVSSSIVVVDTTTLICIDGGENFIALLRRLIRTCWIRISSKNSYLSSQWGLKTISNNFTIACPCKMSILSRTVLSRPRFAS